MTRTILCVAALAILAACGDGNPFTAAEDETPDADANNLYATGFGDDLTMNNLRYDEDADQLVINNLPFDGADGRYSRVSSRTVGAFNVYKSEQFDSRPFRYYAVFRRSDSGNAQVAAVGTDRYVGYGFGGATAQRLNNNVTMPDEGEYVFTGDYAAVRVRGGGKNEQYVSGDIRIDIDIRDFDTIGAVEGIINNRKLYRRNGTLVSEQNDYVALATAEIDFANAGTVKSTATLIEYVTADSLASGDWKAVFAGDNAEEMAGIIVLDSPSSATTEGAFREVGTFLAKD